MIPNFEIIDQTILEIKNCDSYVDLLPSIRCNHKLTDEALLISLGPAKDAIEYLTNGTTVLTSMIFSLREDRYGVYKSVSVQLEAIEAGLLGTYEQFSNLLAKIENN